ncbi:hypothetical protein ACHAP7_006169 [Fusarium lateritium]
MLFSNGDSSRAYVAVDFGETNSAVAYALVPEGTPPETIAANHVQTIRNYPSGMVASKSDPMRLEVPTQLLYPEVFMDRVYHDETPRHHVIETLSRLGEYNPGGKIEVPEMLLLVTIDFLTRLLKHAKSQIMQKRFTITSSEIVICVPVIWSQRAIRNMQTCVSIAAKLAGFPGIRHEDDCISNVFIVSEPEAAATWLQAQGSGIMASSKFHTG